jgi:hypothetical protein
MFFLNFCHWISYSSYWVYIIIFSLKWICKLTEISIKNSDSFCTLQFSLLFMLNIRYLYWYFKFLNFFFCDILIINNIFSLLYPLCFNFSFELVCFLIFKNINFFSLIKTPWRDEIFRIQLIFMIIFMMSSL